MKQISCHIITIILLVSGTVFFQDIVYAATNVEIYGKIGGQEQSPPPPKEPELKPDIELAQPKETHIELTKFPNTGSIVETLSPIGLLLLLIYLLVSKWKAHST